LFALLLPLLLLLAVIFRSYTLGRPLPLPLPLPRPPCSHRWEWEDAALLWAGWNESRFTKRVQAPHHTTPMHTRTYIIICLKKTKWMDKHTQHTHTYTHTHIVIKNQITKHTYANTKNAKIVRWHIVLVTCNPFDIQTQHYTTNRLYIRYNTSGYAFAHRPRWQIPWDIRLIGLFNMWKTTNRVNKAHKHKHTLIIIIIISNEREVRTCAELLTGACGCDKTINGLAAKLGDFG